jgi:hypothetical protein
VPTEPPPPTVTLASLKPDPENRRAHSTRNKAMLQTSLSELGAARSIVIDENDTVLAGNGVVEGATAAGITKVQVIDTDGDTLVAVRRRNLSPEQKRRLAMFDNRTAELAEWNPEQLALDKSNGLDLVPFFTDRELDSFMRAEGLTEVRKQLIVARPTEVAWVLVAIPLEKWPAHQAALEAMEQDAVFASSAIRPRDSHATTKTKNR